MLPLILARLFNLYFRQVFPFDVSRAAFSLSLAHPLAKLDVFLCECVVKINSTSLFFNSNFICLFMLFAGARSFFSLSQHCEITDGRRRITSSRKNQMNWMVWDIGLASISSFVNMARWTQAHTMFFFGVRQRDWTLNWKNKSKHMKMDKL